MYSQLKLCIGHSFHFSCLITSNLGPPQAGKKRTFDALNNVFPRQFRNGRLMASAFGVLGHASNPNSVMLMPMSISPCACSFAYAGARACAHARARARAHTNSMSACPHMSKLCPCHVHALARSLYLFSRFVVLALSFMAFSSFVSLSRTLSRSLSLYLSVYHSLPISLTLSLSLSLSKSH